MSSIESSVYCYCKKPSQTYSTKKGKTMVKCGVALDYGKIVKRLKQLKTNEERHKALQKMKLGCNMNLSFADAQQLGSSHELCFKNFPKCKHDLYAKLVISHSEHNKGRTFWTCPVQFPDIDCGFFQWTTNGVGSESESSSEENDSSSKSKVKAKKNSKRKSKEESSGSKSSSASDSEQPSKKKKKNKKHKA